MKNFFKNFKFLIFAVIAIVTASLIEQNALEPENYHIDTQKFREVLLQKEKNINVLLENSHNKIKLLPENKKNNLFETFADLDITEIKNKGFTLIVYIDDTLKFWTDNSMEFNKKFSESKLNNNVVKLNNAWYYIKILHDKKIDILGLILLRTDYSYENEYLINSFQSEFKIPSSIQLSKVPLSYSFDIQDINNQYLFSLVPTNTIFAKSENWDFNGLLFFAGIAFLFLFLNKWFRQITIQHNNPERRIILVLIFLVFLRYLMLEFKFPLQLYSMSFFDPGYFAFSYLFPSLGDFFINSLLILFFTQSIFYIFRNRKILQYFRNKTNKIKLLFSLFSLIAIIAYFNLVIHLIENLVMNSSIPLEAHRVLELNLFSLIAYTIFAILLASVAIATDKIIKINRHLLKRKEFIFLSSMVIILYGILVFNFKMVLFTESLLYLLFLWIIIIYIHLSSRKYHYSFFYFTNHHKFIIHNPIYKQHH